MQSDYVDPDFWEWYEKYGPSWMLSHRLDILGSMYDAFKDTVVISEGDNFAAVGLKSELEEFRDVLDTALGNRPGKKGEIKNSDIAKVRKFLNELKWRNER